MTLYRLYVLFCIYIYTLDIFPEDPKASSFMVLGGNLIWAKIRYKDRAQEHIYTYMCIYIYIY